MRQQQNLDVFSFLSSREWACERGLTRSWDADWKETRGCCSIGLFDCSFLFSSFIQWIWLVFFFTCESFQPHLAISSRASSEKGSFCRSALEKPRVMHPICITTLSVICDTGPKACRRTETNPAFKPKIINVSMQQHFNFFFHLDPWNVFVIKILFFLKTFGLCSVFLLPKERVKVFLFKRKIHSDYFFRFSHPPK